MGSPNYMSPEQVRSAKNVDSRSDIWSLGVILYELLTGVCPFAGESLGDTLAKIVSEAAEPIGKHRRDLPAGLAAVIHRCLHRRLDARVQSVGELASALLPFAPREAAVSVDRIQRLSRLHSASRPSGLDALALPPDRPVSGVTEQPWLRPGKWTSAPASRFWLPLMVGAAPLVVAAFSFAGWYALRPTPPAASATSSLPSASGDASAPAPASSALLIPLPHVELQPPASSEPAGAAGVRGEPEIARPAAPRPVDGPSTNARAFPSPSPKPTAAAGPLRHAAPTRPLPQTSTSAGAPGTNDYDHF